MLDLSASADESILVSDRINHSILIWSANQTGDDDLIPRCNMADSEHLRTVYSQKLGKGLFASSNLSS